MTRAWISILVGVFASTCAMAADFSTKCHGVEGEPVADLKTFSCPVPMLTNSVRSYPGGGIKPDPSFIIVKISYNTPKRHIATLTIQVPRNSLQK